MAEHKCKLDWESKRVLIKCKNDVYHWASNALAVKSKPIMATMGMEMSNMKNPGGFTPIAYVENDRISDTTWNLLFYWCGQGEMYCCEEHTDTNWRNIQVAEYCLLIHQYDIDIHPGYIDFPLNGEIESADYTNLPDECPVLESVIDLWVKFTKPENMHKLAPKLNPKHVEIMIKKIMEKYRKNTD